MAIAYKGALVIAALSVLSLTTACTGEESKPAAKAEAPAQSADDAIAKKKADAEKPGAEKGIVVPQEEIAQFTALADCVRKAGVNVPAPEAGKTWDTKAMDDIAITPPWSKVLGDCPDWQKLVVGVG